jgi:hypothetical protein
MSFTVAAASAAAAAAAVAAAVTATATAASRVNPAAVVAVATADDLLNLTTVRVVAAVVTAAARRVKMRYPPFTGSRHGVVLAARAPAPLPIPTERPGVAVQLAFKKAKIETGFSLHRCKG